MKAARLCSLFLILAAASSFGGVIGSYLISIDASSLAPRTTGFIDLAFNGGYPATAEIRNFAMFGGGLNDATISTQGTVSGNLSGNMVIANNNASFDEGLTFGSPIRFLVTFSGTPGGTIGDVFTLSFFNSSFSGGLLTGNVNDFWIAQFQLDTKGKVTPTAYPNPAGGPSFASMTAVPEPAAGVLVAIGLLGAVVLRRRAVNPNM